MPFIERRLPNGFGGTGGVFAALSLAARIRRSFWALLRNMRFAAPASRDDAGPCPDGIGSGAEGVCGSLSGVVRAKAECRVLGVGAGRVAPRAFGIRIPVSGGKIAPGTGRGRRTAAERCGGRSSDGKNASRAFRNENHPCRFGRGESMKAGFAGAPLCGVSRRPATLRFGPCRRDGPCRPDSRGSSPRRPVSGSSRSARPRPPGVPRRSPDSRCRPAGRVCRR